MKSASSNQKDNEVSLSKTLHHFSFTKRDDITFKFHCSQRPVGKECSRFDQPLYTKNTGSTLLSMKESSRILGIESPMTNHIAILSFDKFDWSNSKANFFITHDDVTLLTKQKSVFE